MMNHPLYFFLILLFLGFTQTPITHQDFNPSFINKFIILLVIHRYILLLIYHYSLALLFPNCHISVLDELLTVPQETRYFTFVKRMHPISLFYNTPYLYSTSVCNKLITFHPTLDYRYLREGILF